ncbi:MAG: YceI family protein [Crocinitomicaceae bacterium]|nr:YceI family protein [Crocinitomicaceae bacterium]
MKTRIFAISTFVLALSLGACGDADKTEDVVEAPVKSCMYSYNEGTTEFQWTAYKMAEKTAVPGGFNEITVTSEMSEDPKEVMESIEFTMKTSSVNSGNDERDPKIVKHFFETINTEMIEGNVKSLNDDGTAIIQVTMNAITFDIHGEYTLDEGQFEFNSTVDLSAWNALAGLTALNTICKDLHTGEDGVVSKLWSEVALSFSTKLKSDCD